MAYLKDFRERIQNNDYPGFLKIWEEYCYGDQPDGPEMEAVLELMKKSELAKPFGLQVERLLPLWRELKNQKEATDVLRLILDLQTTQSEQLADLATVHLKERFQADPLFNEKMRLVGLRNRDHFQGCIRHFELLMHLQKGNFVFHSAGWGTGEIENFSFVREEISLEFEQVLGSQTLSFEKAFKTLTPLTKEHFYARRFGNPDALEKEAKENPVGIMHMLLHDLGPKTAAEIKDELYDLVIPASDWNRWWQMTRTKLKKDTKILSPKELKDPFVLREKELPHEMAFHQELEAKPELNTALQMIHSFLRDFPETLKNSEFKTSLEEKLKAFLTLEHLNEAQKIQTLLALEILGTAKVHEDLAKTITETPNLAHVIESIDIVPFQKKALQLIRQLRKDWESIFLDLLFSVDSSGLRDFIFAELVESGEEAPLQKKITSLILHPGSHPEVFLWYFQKGIEKKSKLPSANKEGQNRLFEGLLILLDHIEKQPQHRDLVKKILGLITDDRYLLVRNIMQQSTIEEVKEYLLLATKCRSLSDHDVKIFQSLAEVVHPSLSRLRKVKDVSQEEEIVLWTTQEGFQKVQLRMQQIATVETVQNAKEIEIARSHGDLRENAEFKAALERRDRLQSELKFLSDQVASARILTKEDVAEDRVGIGSVVDCRDSKGEHVRFILLGPWDADPDQRILSFQSKLAQSMKGKIIGEKFEFQGEQFLITDIGSYFDQAKI